MPNDATTSASDATGPVTTQHGSRAPKLISIRLSALECVVEHGTRLTTWFVYGSTGWVSVREVPGVVLEPQSAGPGTVWETLATISVRTGTWLMRVDVSPLPQHFSDPLRYLERERRVARRRVRRRYYRVAKDGQLKPAAAADLPASPQGSGSKPG